MADLVDLSASSHKCPREKHPEAIRLVGGVAVCSAMGAGRALRAVAGITVENKRSSRLLASVAAPRDIIER
jgi:hypothetical protein